MFFLINVTINRRISIKQSKFLYIRYVAFEERRFTGSNWMDADLSIRKISILHFEINHFCWFCLKYGLPDTWFGIVIFLDESLEIDFQKGDRKMIHMLIYWQKFFLATVNITNQENSWKLWKTEFQYGMFFWSYKVLIRLEMNLFN